MIGDVGLVLYTKRWLLFTASERVTSLDACFFFLIIAARQAE
jgi:hypothetical protein